MDCKYQYVKMSFRTCPSFQDRTLQDWFDPRSKERQQICFTKLNFKNGWIHILLFIPVTGPCCLPILIFALASSES